ncbi:M48 family metallopeptidase [Ferrimonas futtsuensis]|uniref:M48 family metallopeptidase n=1 Tax=Ferrimonas futtsuensis TaxID=364764 RepID=UPI000487D90F|nr:M48 family metallopeptidase [Ferrimonas futtsuensis]
MPQSFHYPKSPGDVPDGLTEANARYRVQAWLAMTGLLGFILVYFALAFCFGFIAYGNAVSFLSGGGPFAALIAAMAALLTLFMVKSLFTVRRSSSIGGEEVTAEDEPVLFEFLHTLADEIGAPRPHRVFITPEVNAAVFYDLSLINLIFPTKKNLVIGLGLVNVLNLGELKAVLAHEFGHFAQGSMAVGRWVYVAQQVIAHMVAVRDWLDKVVRFISRVDLRVAWIGWILSLVIWSIRSLMDTLFRVVVIAERALSREMEFNADLVAVSVTGSDALVNALYKLQSADEAWQETVDLVSSQARNGKRIDDLFDLQSQAVAAIGRVLNNAAYGSVPLPQREDASQHRVFSKEMALPPQMWSTHPANRDREDNAKSQYIAAEIDARSAWSVFADAQALRERISDGLYVADKIAELEEVVAEQVLAQRYDRPAFSPKYRGTYLARTPFRSFSSLDELFQTASITQANDQAFGLLYTDAIARQLECARKLDVERQTLQALASGNLEPSGGIIRYRGKEITRDEIPKVMLQIAKERNEVEFSLKRHDANCRQTHLLAAQQLDPAWHDYLKSLSQLLHCTDHLRAVAHNELALLTNTWQVITADGQIGYFEKRRILKVCEKIQAKMREISQVALAIELPPTVAEVVGVTDWASQFPAFTLGDVDKGNWPDWCQAASEAIEGYHQAMGLIYSAAIDRLLETEELVKQHYCSGTPLPEAPVPGGGPESYPNLLPGDEHVLQRKLDLWNRFQLAHGAAPTLMRLMVSLAVVGGTIWWGLQGGAL